MVQSWLYYGSCTMLGIYPGTLILVKWRGDWKYRKTDNIDILLNYSHAISSKHILLTSTEQNIRNAKYLQWKMYTETLQCYLLNNLLYFYSTDTYKCQVLLTDDSISNSVLSIQLVTNRQSQPLPNYGLQNFLSFQNKDKNDS